MKLGPNCVWRAAGGHLIDAQRNNFGLSDYGLSGCQSSEDREGQNLSSERPPEVRVALLALQLANGPACK